MKIVEVSPIRTAKDKRNYFVATFSAGFGMKVVRRTFWEQFKRDPKTGELTEEKYWERGSHAEALEAMEKGIEIEGRKVKHFVEPYPIGDREVNTYSTVIFPDENEVQVFKEQNHPIVDPETGELMQPKVVLAAEPRNTDEEEVEEEIETEEEA